MGSAEKMSNQILEEEKKVGRIKGNGRLSQEC